MFLWNCIGAVMGYQFTQSWVGAVGGYFLTSIFIRLLYGRRSQPIGGGVFGGGAWRAGVGSSGESRQVVFLETVFQLMGRLAKADGRISEREVAHTEAFMSQLGMSPDRRREAIGFFKQGSAAEFDVDRALERFQGVVGRSPHLTQLLLVYLLDVALADGEFKGPEEALLRQIAARLGFSEMALEQLIIMTRGQDHFGSRSRSQSSGSGYRPGAASPQSAVAQAYQALGVSEKDSNSAIKRAYRKLISEFHPDKLMGQGVPQDMISAATERSQEIHRAYDVIKDSRGIT